MYLLPPNIEYALVKSGPISNTELLVSLRYYLDRDDPRIQIIIETHPEMIFGIESQYLMNGEYIQITQRFAEDFYITPDMYENLTFDIFLEHVLGMCGDVESESSDSESYDICGGSLEYV